MLPDTTNPKISVSLPGPERARAEKLTIRLEGGAATTIVRTAVLVPVIFVAWMVTRDVPPEVGVPVMAPVRGLTVRPAGSPVAV